MKQTSETIRVTAIAVKSLIEKKAEDISLIDISNVSILADYFLIACGSNKRQVQTLINNLEDCLKKEGIVSKNIEGYQSGSWVLMDYGDLVIHIFDRKSRDFYDLERLWKDGKKINIEDLNNIAGSLEQEEHNA